MLLLELKHSKSEGMQEKRIKRVFGVDRNFRPSGSLFLHQDQDQDSLLVKRRNDNHSPGPVKRE